MLLRVGVRGLCGVCVLCGFGVWRGLARRKNPPCVDSKRPPCVPAPRAHVETHVRVVPEHTRDALNVHTVTFFIGKTCDF